MRPILVFDTETVVDADIARRVVDDAALSDARGWAFTLDGAR